MKPPSDKSLVVRSKNFSLKRTLVNLELREFGFAARQLNRWAAVGKSRGKSMKNHFWIGVVSKAHVMKGVEGGFAQLNHGKKAPLAKMKAGDWIIYYSPRLSLEAREPYQHFTALGKVTTGEVYQSDMGNGFMPYRLDVDFAPCREVSILSLLDKLFFTQGKRNWGQQFRFGHFEISESDFLLLANEMGVNINSNTLE